MKKTKRFTAFLLATLSLSSFCFVSCGDKGESDVAISSEEIITPTEYNLVEDGESDYVIVVPEDCTKAELMAYSDLQTYFGESTDVMLPVITDTQAVYTETSQYISVGNTTLLEAAQIAVDYDVMGANGYTLETKGQSVFIVGGNDYGTLYGVQKFLNALFNYEVYGIDEIVYDTDVKDVKLPDLDMTIVPDIQYITPHYGFLSNDITGSTRLGYHCDDVFMNGPVEVNGHSLVIGGIHNLLGYVPISIYGEHADWYSADKEQLCLSNEEMYQTALLPALKALILANPDLTDVSLTQMDVNTWCSCSKCTEDFQKYGTDSGNLVKFANKAARDIREWLETEYPERDMVNIIIFAYHKTEPAPAIKEGNTYRPAAEELIFEDNLILYFATVRMNNKDALTEGANVFYYENIKAWASMAHTIYVWAYETCFLDYCVPYNTFNSQPKNMKFYKDYNVQMLYSQADWNTMNSTDFGMLSAYLEAKLRWDVNANYQQLIEKFFMNYYKDAGNTMLKLFNKLRAWYDYMENDLRYSGHIFETSRSIEYWPKSVIDEFLKDIDKAYADIQYLEEKDPLLYKTLYDRICLESISFRYLLLQLYPSQYKQSELKQLRMEFRTDADRLNISKYREAAQMSDLYAEWGI